LPSDQWPERMRSLLAPDLEVMRPLGQGSVARVLLAREPALKRLVAVKILREDLAADEVARARFEREAQAAAGVRHPNVTAVYRVGRIEDLPYIVMEYVEGRTLAELLVASGPLEPPEARRILSSVAHALAAAHRQGVVHRDLRPGNILIEEEGGRVVLMDFGIAALLETGSKEVARLTATGVRLGDPLRMSPEQIQGEPVTTRSDVYGLGVVGYEILTGKPPRPVLTADPSGSRPDLTDHIARADPGLVRIIQGCLQPLPNHRPSADEAAQALVRADPQADLQEAPSDLPVLHEFLEEVRRRKVGRVAIAYIAAGFFFLQGVDLLVRALPTGNPDAWYRAIVALTVGGFPVALVLSWLFDLTSEGIQRAQADDSGSPDGRARRLVLPVTALAVSILAAVGAWMLIFRP